MKKLIVGLGNPGKKYAKTRHNIGFRIVDLLKQRITNNEQRTTIFFKPQKFMNLSGQEVLKKANYYKIKLEDLIIIYDDIDLPLGKIRIRKSGRSGGHKGVQSIIDALGSQNFLRVKIGIDRSSQSVPAEKYVLENFSPKEEQVIQKAIDQAVEKVLNLIRISGG